MKKASLGATLFLLTSISFSAPDPRNHAMNCAVYFAADPGFELTVNAVDQTDAKTKATLYAKKRSDLQSSVNPPYVVLCNVAPLLMPKAGDEVFTDRCLSESKYPWGEIESVCGPQTGEGRKLAECAKQKSILKCKHESRQSCAESSEARFSADIVEPDIKGEAPAMRCQAFVDTL